LSSDCRHEKEMSKLANFARDFMGKTQALEEENIDIGDADYWMKSRIENY
jgi:hypothetical protein